MTEPTESVNTIIQEESIATEKECLPPMTGAEIAAIVAGFSEDALAGELVALGSSTAVKLLKAYHEAHLADEPFRLSEVSINPRDLDLIYSGSNFEGYIGEVSGMRWKKSLERITPQSNHDGLRNYPRTTFYKGVLGISTSTREEMEIEIFDNFTYGGKNKAGQDSDKHPVFTMDIPSSRFITISDVDKVSIVVPDPSVLALQSFLYSREGKGDLERAKDLIDIYLSDKDKDIFSLMELAKEVCPHKSMPFAKFVFDYVEEKGLEESILEHYFGDRSATAFKLTRKMLDLFNPQEFPYHNFFGHVLPSLKLVKQLIDDGLINPKYAKATMLGIYMHESGLNIEEGPDGHVERGADNVVVEDQIAAELVSVTALEYIEGDGLVPRMFVDANRDMLTANLERLGVPREDAKQMLYLIGFADIENIIQRSGIHRSFEVLQEDFLNKVKGKDEAEKKVEAAFVSDKGGFYIGLYRNLRDGILSRIDRDYSFSKVFYGVFGRLNGVDYEQIRANEGSTSNVVKKDLISLIGEKIDFWRYIQSSPMILSLIQEKYNTMLFATKDPKMRIRLEEDFNDYITRIHTRSMVHKISKP